MASPATQWGHCHIAGGTTVNFLTLHSEPANGVGERLLELLSISVESLQVAGGLVLVLVALQLLGPARTDTTAHAPGK